MGDISVKLSDKIRDLENNKYLDLTKHDDNTVDNSILFLIAKIKNIKIISDHTTINYITPVIFKQIENAINIITSLNIVDYSNKNRKTLYLFSRIIFSKISLDNGISKELTANKLNINKRVVSEYEVKHDNLIKYNKFYNRMYKEINSIVEGNYILNKFNNEKNQ